MPSNPATVPSNAYAIAVGNPLSGFTFYGPFLEKPEGDQESPAFDLAQDLGFESDAPDGSSIVPLVSPEQGHGPHPSGLVCGRRGLVFANAPTLLSRRLLGLVALVASRLPADEPETALASALVREAEALGLLPVDPRGPVAPPAD